MASCLLGVLVGSAVAVDARAARLGEVGRAPAQPTTPTLTVTHRESCFEGRPLVYIDVTNNAGAEFALARVSLSIDNGPFGAIAILGPGQSLGETAFFFAGDGSPWTVAAFWDANGNLSQDPDETTTTIPGPPLQVPAGCAPPPTLTVTHSEICFEGRGFVHIGVTNNGTADFGVARVSLSIDNGPFGAIAILGPGQSLSEVFVFAGTGSPWTVAAFWDANGNLSQDPDEATTTIPGPPLVVPAGCTPPTPTSTTSTTSTAPSTTSTSTTTSTTSTSTTTSTTPTSTTSTAPSTTPTSTTTSTTSTSTTSTAPGTTSTSMPSTAPSTSPECVSSLTDDVFAVTAGQPLEVPPPGVLENDTVCPGDAITVLDAPDHGTLRLNVDGSFSYTPVAGFVGFDSFAYGAGSAATSAGFAGRSFAGGTAGLRPQQVTSSATVTIEIGVAPATTSTTAPTTTSEPTTTPQAGELPATGTAISADLLVGIVALACGTVLVLMARRRGHAR